MSFNYSPKIVTDGLISYLDAGNTKSYVSGSNTWSDLSKNQNNSTLINGPLFDSSNLGSIVFDGINDYVNVPRAIVTTAFTINMWIKPTGDSLTGSTSYSGMVNRFNGYNNQRNRFLINAGFTFFNFQAIVSGVTYDILSDTFSSVLNKNSMATVTYNGSNVKFYLNVNSVMITPFSMSGSLDSGTLAATIGWGANSTDYFFNGKIYTYQVYNKSLSDIEITQNYNALKGRFII